MELNLFINIATFFFNASWTNNNGADVLKLTSQEVKSLLLPL